MVGAGVDLELGGLLAAEAGVGKHPLHRLLDDLLRPGGQHVGERAGLEPTGVAGVVVVDDLLRLRAGQHDLLGVDDDDEVTGVDVRGEVRLVLAAQEHRDLRSETPEHHVRGVDDVPGALDIGGLGLVRAHVKAFFDGTRGLQFGFAARCIADTATTGHFTR